MLFYMEKQKDELEDMIIDFYYEAPSRKEWSWIAGDIIVTGDSDQRSGLVEADLIA